jgi:hypothetical protein
MAIINSNTDSTIWTVGEVDGGGQLDIKLLMGGNLNLTLCFKCIGYTGGEYMVNLAPAVAYDDDFSTWTLIYKKPGVYSLKNKMINTFLGVCNGCFGSMGPPMPVNVKSINNDSNIDTQWNITKI